MKKEKRWLFGIIALIAVLAFAMTACPGNDPGGTDIVDDGGDTVENPRFTVSGKFTNGGTTSYFKAQESAGNAAASFQRSAFRAASDNEVPLAGTLDDGDITFRLKGFYDAESGAYTLQAASSVIKYSITGTAEGKTSASIATRGSAAEPFGTPTYVLVTTEVTGADLAAGMTSTNEADLVEGFTKNDAWGVWYNEDAEDPYKYIVNEWGISGMLQDPESGEWEEDQTLGFSKVVENDDGSITVIGDAMVTYMWSDPWESKDSEEFTAWMEKKGYQTYDGYTPPLPTNGPIFGWNYFNQGKFNGSEYDRVGALVKGNGTYLVEIFYNPEINPDTPFMSYVEKDGDKDLYIEVNPAATLEAALEGALNAIKRTGDSAAKYDPLPWTISTAGVNVGLKMYAWEAENPRPNWDDFNSDNDAYKAAYDTWNTGYFTLLEQQLLANFSQKFNADKLITENDGWRYWNLRDQFGIETGRTKVEYKTEYYKWNVVEKDGKLSIKPYCTDSTMFGNSYAEAEAFTVLSTEFITLSRTR